MKLDDDYWKAAIEKIVTCIEKRDEDTAYAGDRLALDSPAPRAG